MEISGFVETIKVAVKYRIPLYSEMMRFMHPTHLTKNFVVFEVVPQIISRCAGVSSDQLYNGN